MPVNQDNPLWNFWPRNRVRLSWLFVVALLLWIVLCKPQPLSIVSPSGLIACLLMIDGIFLRSWSAGIVHKDQKLATIGPYALCRHPLYMGSFFTACGVMLMLGGWWLMLLAAAFFLLLYIPTARNEEQVLATEFAEQWPAYVQATAMLFPRSLSAAFGRMTEGAWSAAQWRYNREYQTPLMTIAVVMAIQIIRNWSA
jgi:protein-S-isoprenylcysteine O-methyltransferase Ste14